MNYLAHVALCDGSSDAIVGNFLGDFVKGRPEGRYPPPVVAGIRLHRRLDIFTDNHPVVRRAVERIPRCRRRFAWIAIDMAFDHFLARSWHERAPDDFADFRARVYTVLRTRRAIMPPRARRVVGPLSADDWLGSYADWQGTVAALHGMSRRLSRPTPLAETITDMEAVYRNLQGDFEAFWPAIRRAAEEESRRLLLPPDQM